MFSWLWPRKDKPRGQPPKFIEPLKPQRVEHGSKTVLETTVKGNPTPRVLWYHLEQEILPSQEFVQEYDATTGRAALTISEVFIDDTGLYRCLAVNQHGQDETATYLTVEDLEILEKQELRQAPRITFSLQPQIVKKASPLVLQARFEAFPPPTVKWYHQGKELKPSLDYKIEHFEDETTLCMEEVFEDDTGEYEVKVFNEAGEARSVATVIVTQPEEVIEMTPPKFIKPLQPQIIPEGEVAFLEAEVTSKPEAEFTWFRHGQKITSDEELEVQITSVDNKSSLVLGELFEDDSGDYTVTAQNLIGRASSTATLLVEGEGAEEAEPPAFNPPLTPIRVMDGDEISFKCRVTGRPKPRLLWLQNGRPIGHHREVHLTQTPDGQVGLEISEVFPEDAGDYTCIARNKAGEARTTANLAVESYEYLPDSEVATVTSVSDKAILSPSEEEETEEIEKGSESDTSEAGSSPFFVTRLAKVVEVKEGSPVRLITKPTGYPKPTVKWHVDNMPIETTENVALETYEDGTSVLNIPHATLDDCGEYTCEALNRNGVDTTVTTVVVLQEHTEETSKLYRKPDWVTRMEDLKEAMTGIVERSRARRRGAHPNSSQDSASRPVLQSPQPMLQTSQPMQHYPQPVMQSPPPPPVLSCPSVCQSSYSQCSSVSNSSLSSVAQPVLPAASQSEQGMCLQSSSAVSCVSPSSRPLIVPRPVSQEPCIWVGSVISTSTYRTSISVDSLERSSVSINQSCMSSKDTVSECDTEIESECQSDIPPNELQSDRLSHFDLASSLSFGDLSMGSDSVFISESETPSRRHSDQTVGSSYMTEDQDNLIATKLSLLSPNTKHVHFKFDGDTPSTVSEDETQTDSPNYAKTVMSHYLSSHRNSISQVIEALSSLAQADITAEIEMTIEQNKKQKLPEKILSEESNHGPLFSNGFKSVVDGNVPTIATGCTPASDHSRIQVKSEKKTSVKDENESENYTVSTSIDISSPFSGNETPDQHISAVCLQKGSVDVESLRSTADSRCSLANEIPKQEQHNVIETVSTSTLESSNIKSADKKIHRKSILKNTASKSILAPDVAKTENSNQPQNVEITRHQLTPTLRQKPILKKVEAVVLSSCSNYQDASSQNISCKQDETPQAMNSKVQIGSSKVNRYVAKSKPQDQKFKTECKISLNKFEMATQLSKESNTVDMQLAKGCTTIDKPQGLISNSTRLCSSLPATPTLTRKEQVTPPNKLPLITSYGSVSENQRESKIPRLSKSNESTPVSTPKQMRKLSPKGENCHKMSREPSSDSLIGVTETPKRSIWSEPSSPLTTPQLIRKTFKQIHENTKIPMPIYQYSSTEELEDSSPQESPRLYREKRQRCLVRPPRTMSVDRGMDQSNRKFSDEIIRTSRTRSPLPVAPKVPSPSGKPATSDLSQPSSPIIGRVKSPVFVKSPASSQSSSIYTSPGSSPMTILSPVTSRKSLFTATCTPKTLQTIKPKAVPTSTPVMSQGPGPTQVKSQNLVSDSSCQSSGEITVSTAPAKVSRISRITLFPLKEPVNRNPSKKSLLSSKYISASDSEQCTNITSDREKSHKSHKSGNLRRADSLEEFLLLENECMD